MSYTNPLGLTRTPPPYSDIFAFANRLQTAPHLTDKEWGFFERLEGFSEFTAGRELCRELGQEIFDYFKAAASQESNPEKLLAYPESQAGLNAMRNIAYMLKANDFDDVARAWDGVGDDKYRWEYSFQPNKSLKEYNSLLLNEHLF